VEELYLGSGIQPVSLDVILGHYFQLPRRFIFVQDRVSSRNYDRFSRAGGWGGERVLEVDFQPHPRIAQSESPRTGLMINASQMLLTKRHCGDQCFSKAAPLENHRPFHKLK